MAVILLLFLVVLSGVALGAFTAFAIWIALLFKLLDVLVQQVPRGVVLFLRLVTEFAVRSAKLVRWLYRRAARGGLWAAQHAYVWLFVWSYRLREWYVSSEIQKRDAH